ncbi:MAG: hypothetical protein ABS43_23950 [Bordetella sp. SCN 67-23]|nr:DUF3717 domain-containing protein [Burkholderiales bacterium]ODS70091.1 MAG: hypothetical protein ABS43_23950 [Bordetella sp. SCN 67-23]ODU85482.1 MAG: hypothetical protein ABT00_09580 [Bordetella sp. SCN 68-11]OJW89161.1 MAG: hypothetical protein BGO71_21035 [Burkholderiales bacterium 67-32]
MDITLTELEDAINFWRARKPSTSEACVLCVEAAALAEPYAAMIMNHQSARDEAAMPEAARAALSAWRQARQAIAQVKG